MDSACAADLAPNGTLRAAINLGNPVLAQGTAEAPSGVTVDIAAEFGERIGVPVEFHCFDAARTSFEALRSGTVDLCFLAREPAREQDVAFTAPYVVIEGVYAVPRNSTITTLSDVDYPGVRIGVKHGSAYDLFLTRTLQHATVIRGRDGTEAFRAEDLDVAAGIRQPVAAFVADDADVRLIDGAFMQIRQAVGTSREKRPGTVRFLHDLVEELKGNGFVGDALRRAGQDPGLVAPAA